MTDQPTKPHDSTKAPQATEHQRRYLLRGQGGIGSNAGRKRPKISLGPMPDSIANHVPDQQDVNYGWWLNNAILHKMGLKKLGPEGCSWIDGHPNEKNWTYCGARRLRGVVYCERHQRRSWQKPKTEETPNDQTQQGPAVGPAKHDEGRSRKAKPRTK